VLCGWQGLDTRDAAAALGVREPTVRTRLHRARRRLRALADTSTVHAALVEGVCEP
jgi:RNA polymerase sigma-70 factor (ECF subfamily)